MKKLLWFLLISIASFCLAQSDDHYYGLITPFGSIYDGVPAEDVIPPIPASRYLYYDCDLHIFYTGLNVVADEVASMQYQYRHYVADSWAPASPTWSDYSLEPEVYYNHTPKTCYGANQDSFYARYRLKDIFGNTSGYSYIDSFIHYPDTTVSSIDTMWTCYTPPDSDLVYTMYVNTSYPAIMSTEWKEVGDPTWKPGYDWTTVWQTSSQQTRDTDLNCLDIDSIITRYMWWSYWAQLTDTTVGPTLVMAAGPSSEGPIITKLSGSVWDDSVLTIIGSGFGKRLADADQPMIWEDFEDYTADTYWSSGTNNLYNFHYLNTPRVVNDFSCSGDKSLRWDNYGDTATQRWGGVYAYWGGTVCKTMFVSCQIRVENLAGTTGSYRFLKLSPRDLSCNEAEAYPNEFGFPNAMISGSGTPSLWSHNDLSHKSADNAYTEYCIQNAGYQHSIWMPYQIWANYGTIDTEDGAYGGHLYDEQCRQSDVAMAKTGSACTTKEGWKASPLAYKLHINAKKYCWLDDVYVDSTWARVEIHESKDFAESDTIAMQIPFYWHDDTIQVYVNRGNFGTCGLGYLFVVTAGDTISNSVEIYWGEYRDD